MPKESAIEVEQRVSAVESLLRRFYSPQQITKALGEQLKCTPKQVQRYIKIVHRRWAYTRTPEEKARSLAEHCATVRFAYQQALEQKEYGAAERFLRLSWEMHGHAEPIEVNVKGDINHNHRVSLNEAKSNIALALERMNERQLATQIRHAPVLDVPSGEPTAAGDDVADDEPDP